MFTSAAYSFESVVGTLHSFNVMLLPAHTTPMTLLYVGELMNRNFRCSTMDSDGRGDSADTEKFQ